jgi:RNA-directed DNA polymerase
VKVLKEGKQGKYRTLGISDFEDNICQKLIQKTLESIYEPIFYKMVLWTQETN